jgi:hypothetical protein
MWANKSIRTLATAGMLSLTTQALWASGPSLKGQQYLIPGVGDYRLLVKFAPEAGPDIGDDGGLILRNAASAAPAPSMGGGGLRYRRAVPFNAEEMRELATAGSRPLRKTTPGEFDILAFSGLMYVDAPGADKHRLMALAREFETRDDVEYATLESAVQPPPPGDIAPVTPVLSERQGYLGPNPGIDCKYAWSLGVKGKGVRISDIEHSWGDFDHEDLMDQDLAYGLPKSTDDFKDHGIGIFGVIFGGHNGYGIDGCVPEASGRGYSVLHGRAAALIRASADSKAGDIILLEMQAGGPEGKLMAADIDVSVWNATKAATEAGRIVVGTAGNGGANTDLPAYAAYRGRGDNGVIMEGAGSSDTRHVHLSFSSYGATVHVQGWGQNVFTTGYGAFAKYGNDAKQSYTASFNGTSSGGAVVSAAVASIQCFAQQKLNKTLTPREMRDLLLATGTPQGPGNHIGPLPNIRAAIEKLNGGVAVRPEPGTGSEAMLVRQGATAILNLPGSGGRRVEIADLHGRVHLRAEMRAGLPGQHLDLTALPKGLLILRVRGGGRVWELKLPPG